jgi:tRNA pseudouridine32 synthase/23S rRNA pseudouridine746 synthase
MTLLHNNTTTDDDGSPDPSLTLRVVEAHQGFVVINKPSGMLSVPGIGPRKQVCVISHVKAMFPHATGPMMVHRLDMETSGLLVVALTPAHQVALSSLFEQRLVTKAYTALLDCSQTQPRVDAGIIDLPLRLDVDRRPYQIVDFAFGKPAQTRFRILSCEVDRARVRFEPITGRTHQLRVHAAAPLTLTNAQGSQVPGGLACPIVGDVLYGIDGTRKPRQRLMLHASELSFRDPISGTFIDLTERPEF